MIIKGSEVIAAANERLKDSLRALNGPIPQLAVVRVGGDAGSLAYESSVMKRLGAIGLKVRRCTFAGDIGGAEFSAAFAALNRDPEVDGILLLRPLPAQIDENAVRAMIDPGKDVDGLGPANMAKVFMGDESGFAPCTAEAVMEILRYAGIEPAGKRAVIIGRSALVGRPLAMLLLQQDATITICHTQTADMEKICRNSEIVVAAAGRAKLINKRFIADGAVVIDVGINTDQAGNLCGDVDFDDVVETASFITPVPDGVGTVTTAVLAQHVMRAAARRRSALPSAFRPEGRAAKAGRGLILLPV
ncbi:MAG: bifunctional 5,10-methylenetetrahydrofolate dehydrogenase/5,10-methenyltetrahydrofolate cyclohydrolase [Acidaminococcales bacterium]|jgi:methylenetetrahydrofolate dehydrogenase (NADP+)/methenyltetrahydrofolate cyclohydrolase|nr:bifunctional 5,10-methylenetetrahydrofolate dehydrogenase/5,10-methenyltetrahydrofolate cyclohydrolase [Acidaminococcales bacterium]